MQEASHHPYPIHETPCCQYPCPLRIQACTEENIPMAVHPSFLPPKQWCLASPVGFDLIPVSLGCSLYHSSPQSLAHHSLAPQAISTQPTLGFILDLTPGTCVSEPSPHPSISGCGVPGVVPVVCLDLSLLFPPQSSCCTFLESLKYLHID